MNLDPVKAFRDDLREYFARANFLFQQATNTDNEEWIRSLSIVYTVYAFQAAFEIAQRAVLGPLVDKEKVKQLSDEFKGFVSEKVRYLYLIDSLRSRDFHRGAITFREGQFKSSGPITLSVREAGESVAVFPDATGRSTIYRTKNGKEIAQPVHKDTILEIHGFNVLEPLSGKWMPILQVLAEHGTDLQKLFLPEGHGSTVTSTPNGP
jgi:hypothetical protein